MDNAFRTILAVACGFAGILIAPVGHVAAEPAAVATVRLAELSPEAETAISKAHRYLAATQNPDGSWGSTYKCAETSLALMAFMVKGEFPDQGTYGQKLARSVDYLVRRGQEQGGFLGGPRQGMYEHGLATLALSEVWGQSDNDHLRDVLKKAVEVILRSQNQAGGWRYGPQPSDADISATVMQIMALSSAKDAGILVPDEALNRAVRYVQSCQHTLGGFSYQPGGVPGFARTAAGVMSLCMTGQRNSPAVLRGLAYLVKYDTSKFTSVSFYYYAHYYAIQAVYQGGDAYYQPWYPRIRDALLAKQQADGGWGGGEGGTTNTYATSISVLILGVPYRYLPIYQR